MIDPSLIQPLATIFVALISGIVSIIVAYIQTVHKLRSAELKVFLPEGVTIENRLPISLRAFLLIIIGGAVTGYVIGGALENTLAAAPTPKTIPRAIPVTAPTASPTTQRNCDSTPPPCSYRVREGDYFILIAHIVYGSRDNVMLIMNANRDAKGNFKALHRGDILLIPAPEVAPPTPYPGCGEGKYPCVYRAYRGDTYQTIAEDFYRDPSLGKYIRAANGVYDPIAITVLPPNITEGTLIVVPDR